MLFFQPCGKKNTFGVEEKVEMKYSF